MTLGIDFIGGISKDLENAAKENKFDENTYELVDDLVHKLETVIKELDVIREKYSKV